MLAAPRRPRRLHRRVALAASRIMSGEPAAELPVSITRDGRLFLNVATATRIGVSPPFEVIIEAEAIDESLPPGAHVFVMNSNYFEEIVAQSRGRFRLVKVDKK